MKPIDNRGATDISPYVSHRIPEAPAPASGCQDPDARQLDSGYQDSGQSTTPWEARVRTDADGRSSPVRRMEPRIGVKPGDARLCDHGPDARHGCYVSYQYRLEEVINALTDLAAKRNKALPVYTSTNAAYSDAMSEADDAVLFSVQWRVTRQASELSSAADDAWNALTELDQQAANLIIPMIENAEPDADPKEVKRELLALYLGDYATHAWYASFLHGL